VLLKTRERIHATDINSAHVSTGASVSGCRRGLRCDQMQRQLWRIADLAHVGGSTAAGSDGNGAG
jgi:hypothetical protein